MIWMLLFLALSQRPEGFEETWNNLETYLERSNMERDIHSVVQFFVGRPYLVGSLEGEGPETLRYHLDGFDCFTLTESAIAFSLLKEPDQEAYEDLLLKTRYRDGKLQGYQSRLHYATEWGDRAVELGILEDVTSGFKGAQPWSKTIDFMTKHRSAYAKLADEQVFNDIEKFEKRLSQRKRNYVGLDELEANKNNFLQGDIIMILTKKNGLDVGHFCYVTEPISDKSTSIGMVHASSTQKKIVRVEDMFQYIRNYPKVLGVMVFRLKKA